MSSFNRQQLIIAMAFYYFDYSRSNQKNLKKFTERFNFYFGSDINTLDVSYLMSLFKSIDPSFNVGLWNAVNADLNSVWIYYIEQDRIKELKTIYQSFKKNKIGFFLVNDDDSMKKQLETILKQDNFSFAGDLPKDLYKKKKTEIETNKRDLIVSYNALKLANFKCEYNSEHQTFVRKNIDINYTEGHHLIPLEYQHLFNVNLDVEANVVSLCSNCHNQIHYGRDYEVIIKKLFANRKERLQKCGIKITLRQLLDMYK